MGHSQYRESDIEALNRIQGLQLLVFVDRFWEMDHWAIVTARLYMTCPVPGNTRFISIRLATSLRSLAIILPLYYSTILTSTSATVCADIQSYEAIHGRMPLHYYCSSDSDTFRVRDFINHTFPTGYDTLSTREIWYRFERTDCSSEASGYIYWIEVDGNRDDCVRIPEANRPEMRRHT